MHNAHAHSRCIQKKKSTAVTTTTRTQYSTMPGITQIRFACYIIIILSNDDDNRNIIHTNIVTNNTNGG